MSADEFLTWCLTQEGKWELVNGTPIQMMAGATQAHDRVVTNLIIALGARLRGTGCWPMTDDVAARMPRGNIRRPDVTVDCAPMESNALESKNPKVFFEVLSPSSHGFDLVKKPEEYRGVASLQHFVVIDPAAPRALVWSRDGDAWRLDEPEGLGAEIDLAGIGASLPLSEVYDGLSFDA
jgi:Uma2 family endonuclease